jgi:two-component sensor histidine kinase
MPDPVLARLAKRLPPVIGYLAAIVAVGVVLLLRLTALAIIPGYSLILFYPTVVLIALLCGLGPGLIASVLSLVAAWFFLMPPPWSFALAEAWEMVVLAIYFSTATMLCFLMHWLRLTIRRLQAEREQSATLYQELNHRVRNSLQLAGSMLAVQASSARGEPEVKAALDNATARVRAIGVVHESLVISSDLKEVELARYLEKVCRQLVEPTALDCTIEVGPIWIATKRASILAMIAHELITNVAKYAYPAGTGGPIRISCRREPDGMVRLTVADRGVGLPESVQPAEGGGLGMRIIRLLTKQLDGRLEMKRQGGTQISIIVPVA